MKKPLIFPTLCFLFFFLYFTRSAIAGPTSSSFELENYSFGAGGANNLQSATYKALGILGEIQQASLSSALFRLGGGLAFETMANTPPAPTLSNPATNYDRLKIIVNKPENAPDDYTYAVSISTDNFQNDIRYVKSDKTPGSTLTASDFQDYDTFWEGASGTFISGLTNNYGTSNFGRTIEDQNGYFNLENGDIVIAKYPLSEPGTITSLSTYARGGGATSQSFRLVIYADNGGAPGTLKGITGEMTLLSSDTTYSWRSLNITGGGIYLPAGDYWIGMWGGPASNNLRWGRHNTTGGSVYGINSTYSSINPPPDPLTAGGVTDTSNMMIYATYNTSPKYSVRVKARQGNLSDSFWSSTSEEIALSDPSLTFGLNTSNITFNNLNAGNSYTDDTKQTTLTTSTNSYNGYVVWANEDNELSSEEESISNYSATNDAPTVWSGTGFGYNSNDSDLQTGPGSANRFVGSKYAGFGVNPNQDPVADYTTKIESAPLNNNQFIINYKVVAPSAAVGSYRNIINYTVVPIY